MRPTELRPWLSEPTTADARKYSVASALHFNYIAQSQQVESRLCHGRAARRVDPRTCVLGTRSSPDCIQRCRPVFRTTVWKVDGNFSTCDLSLHDGSSPSNNSISEHR